MSGSVEIQGMEATLSRIDSVASYGGERTMRVVALVMEQELRNAFRDQADPWGSSWPAHADATIQKRLRAGNTSTQKLIDTGAMYASTEHASTSDSASVSMDGPAEVHQFGNSRIPPRPMFPVDHSHDGPPQQWWDAVTAPIVRAIGGDNA